MRKTLEGGEIPLDWDAANLLSKAQRYFEKMYEQEIDSWSYGLFSSLGLELLARAALSNVSPALLADFTNGDWHSLFNALGYVPKAPRFQPKSVSLKEVCLRLSEMFPNFDISQRDFCINLGMKRNSELHSGATPFEGVGSGSWQPKFYRSCATLLSTMGLELSTIMPDSEVAAAHAMMAADQDQEAKAVLGEIEAHKKVWDCKDAADKVKLAIAAVSWATKQSGHRVNCPSCGSTAIVVGPPVGDPKMTIKDDLITEVIEHLPTKFECTACGLKISGVIKLTAAGLANRYKNTTTYDAIEYYTGDAEFDYAPDNNE